MTPDIAGALGAGYTSQEIITALAASNDPMKARMADALKAGYSPDEIVDHLNPKADRVNVQGVPILAPIDRGIAHLRDQGANLAQDLGFTNVASGIRQSIPQATLHARSSGAALSEDLGSGRYLSALSNLPSAALEQAVPLAGGLVAGAASGGSLPAVAAASAGIGAIAQGDAIARQRATNNGRAEPSAADLALGVGGGALTGAAGAIGLRGVGTPGVGAALGNTVRHGLADAAQPEMASLAGSVGTTAGAQHASGADIAGAALTGLATRGALGAPDAINGVRETIQARTPEGQRAAFDALPADQQQHTMDQARAAEAMRSVQQDVAGPGKVSDPIAAASAASRMADQVTSLAGTLDRSGVLPEGGKAIISDAVQAAQSPSRVLLRSHLDAIDGLGLGETAGTIQGSLRSLNLLSSPEFTTRPQGPVEGVMRAAGTQAAGAALGSISGPGGAVLGALAGQSVKGAGGAAFGTLGRSIDRLAGLAGQSELAQARTAAAMLEASGIGVPDTLGQLGAAMGQARDAIAVQRDLMARERTQQADTKAADKAAGDQFRADYSDARTMDRQRTRDLNGERAAEVSDAKTMDRQLNQGRDAEIGDAKAVDRQLAAQRAGEVADATAMDRQRTQAQATERAGQVADAKAIDATQTRGTNLLEREGGTVAMMALRRSQVAQEGSRGVVAPGGPLDPVAVATARAKAGQSAPSLDGASGGRELGSSETPALDRLRMRDASTGEVTGIGRGDPAKVALDRAALLNPEAHLAAPMPGMEGMSAAAKAQGALLPDWQYGLGKNLSDALALAGTPKNINTAQEVHAAVRSLRDRGAFDGAFAADLLGHPGRVVRGVYNLIRNEMLLAHGIDMRTLEAQAPARAAP